MACVGRSAALGGLLVALLAGPPEAQGSFVQRGDGLVFYLADPGEQNELTIDSEPGVHILSDPGATVSAAPPCITDGTTALCPAQPSDFVFVDLSDANDSLESLSDFSVGACTGTGDDVAVGGEPRDVFRGEGGHDTLVGRGGNDTLNTDAPCESGGTAPGRDRRESTQ